MPFAEVSRSSLALGLLQAQLLRRGIRSTAFYPGFWLAREVDLSLYQRIADGYPATTCLVGEWLFAPWLAAGAPPQIGRYLRTLGRLSLIAREGSLVLGLPLKLGRYQPPARVIEPLASLLLPKAAGRLRVSGHLGAPR